MDPLRKILMTNNGIKPSKTNLITIEEGIDCREANSRFFSLLNHETRLNIIISKTCSIISCKLAGHEIVIDPRQYNQLHETWAIGDRPYQKIGTLPWNCHVRGSELMLSTSNNNSSIIFELTKFNELNSVVKLKSIHLQHQVTYFNLNNAKKRVPIDGHTLVVQCNGNMNRIQVQNTKLLCQCNRRASILAQSLIGDIPFELVQHDASVSLNICDNQQQLAPQQQPPPISGNNDDLIVCDSIFSIEATCPLDYLRIKLQYNERSVLFEARSTNSSGGWPTTSSNHNGGATNVSSSTNQKGTKLAQFNHDAHQQQQASSSSMEPSSVSGECSVDLCGDTELQDQWLSSLLDSPSTSCPAPSAQLQPQTPTTTFGNIAKIEQNSDQPTPAPSSLLTQHPATILRARVRVTNFGVCIMPLMMTNYSFTYRFTW